VIDTVPLREGTCQNCHKGPRVRGQQTRNAIVNLTDLGTYESENSRGHGKTRSIWGEDVRQSVHGHGVVGWLFMHLDLTDGHFENSTTKRDGDRC
jgi:hypothetical protein